MRMGDSNKKAIAFGAMILFSAPFAAHATTPSQKTPAHKTTSHSVAHHATTHHAAAHHVAAHHAAVAHPAHITRASDKHTQFHHRHGKLARVMVHGIQCVTFARSDTGIVLKGNAADWWAHAAGVYQRGERPEVGAVLNFRANPRMRLGHVAVVSNVIDARTVEIDQANWRNGSTRHGGAVSRSTLVVDVSPNNDWTAVRVGLDHAGDYGSIYPTYGFIYARPDNGTEVATNTAAAAPAETNNSAPSDLRRGPSYDEVAEAPASSGIDTNASLGLDAPDRAIQ